MAQLFEDLKRRNVFRVGVAYAIVGWLLVEVASVVLPTFEAPEWVMQVFTFLIVLGLPIALVLAWAFELTPGGITRDQGASAEPEQTPKTSEKTPTAEPTAPGKSIAVLPFVNMSSDPEQEYFSDGLTEEILNLLAKVPGLKVIARTSSFAFKGKNEDVRSIGQALDVNTVLEGSVRKSGDRVRVTTQLIEVSDGAHLWSESYDREMTDIFDVQDSVASAILQALRVHVGASPTRGRPTENTEAYALFLKARAAMNRMDASNAADLLMEAVELDPSFAEAHEQLAYVYWWQEGTYLSAADAATRMHDAAAKALAIDPNLVFARAFSSENRIENTYLKEIEALERVLREEPSHAGALDTLIENLLTTGYFREALGLSERFVNVDPLSPGAHWRLAQALEAAGRIDESRATVEFADQLGSEWAHLSLAMFDLGDEHDESAIAHLEALLQQNELPTSWIRDFLVGARDSVSGQAHLDSQLPKVLASLEDQFPAIRMCLFMVYLYLGYLDRCFELIEEESTGWIGSSIVYVATINQRSGFTAHPRYLEVAKEIGLIEVWEQRGPPDFCEKVNGQWVCE